MARGAPLPWLRCVTTITCAYLGQSCPYGGMTPLLGVAPSEKVIGLPKVYGVGVACPCVLRNATVPAQAGRTWCVQNAHAAKEALYVNSSSSRTE